MSDEREHDSERNPKSIPAPPTVPRLAGSPSSPPGPPVPGSGSGGASMVHFRRTTKMSADEIASVIAETERAKAAGDFDPEKTMVVEHDDVLDADEAPTMDYDPRARGVFSPSAASKQASFADTPDSPAPPKVEPAAFEGHGVPNPRPSEAGRRRSSRRTVRIPDDPVQRRSAPTVLEPAEARARGQEGRFEQTPVAEEAVTPEPGRDDAHEPGTSTSEAEARYRELYPLMADYPSGGELNDEVTIVKPLRIISIGSDPPPPVTSAEAVWPPVRAYVEPESDAVAPVDVPRTDVPSTTKTDLLPPPMDVIESGWTPTPVEVSELAPPSNPEIETSELLEDVEPDAAPIRPLTTPKRPPPPPKTKDGARPAEDLKSTAVEPAAKPKPKPWFEDLFTEDYLQTMDVLSPENVRLEVDFIEDSLGVEKQAVVLDLGCGRGEHAAELASRGYSVVGVDLSPAALAIAHASTAQSQLKSADGQKPSFLRADMRELDFEENFDGAYCWSTSFGYFDDETNINVLRRLHRALRQGGMLLLDVVNRDFVAPRSPGLVWFEGDRCICMDDMFVDFLSSRLRVKRTAMFEDGHSRELEYTIRLYTLSELGKMLHDVGFRVVEVTGHLAHPGIFFGTESPRLVILAERS